MRAALGSVGARGLIGTRTAHVLRLLPELRGGSLLACPDWLPFTERLDDLLGEPLAPPDTSDDRVALLTFTTGSTGRAKATPRTHGLLDAQRGILYAHMGLGSDDVDLATLPIFALASLAAGVRVRLADCDLRRPGEADPARIAAQLETGVTTCTASPAFFRQVVRSGSVFPGMRAVFTGGARVPASLLREMCRVFPNARVEVVYGSSEAEPIATIDAREALTEIDAVEREGKGALVGTPVAEVDVWLRDPDTGMDVSDVGEVVVAGPHVNPGYWRDPEADARTKLTRDGRIWHRTGDLARRDAGGRLLLLGRVGEQVDGFLPFPVEAAAERVAGVTRAALMEIEGDAVLVYSGDADATALRDATGVGRVMRVREIPVDRRHGAKVDRAQLRRLLG
jgi:acyl-CoA synthetase (AMP-forming)/AMP-acid ligase II